MSVLFGELSTKISTKISLSGSSSLKLFFNRAQKCLSFKIKVLIIICLLSKYKCSILAGSCYIHWESIREQNNKKPYSDTAYLLLEETGKYNKHNT